MVYKLLGISITSQPISAIDELDICPMASEEKLVNRGFNARGRNSSLAGRESIIRVTVGRTYDSLG